MKTLKELRSEHDSYCLSASSKMSSENWQSLEEKLEHLILPLFENQKRLKILSLGCGAVAELNILLEWHADKKIPDFDFVGFDTDRRLDNLYEDYERFNQTKKCDIKLYHFNASDVDILQQVVRGDNNKFDVVIFRHPLPANYNGALWKPDSDESPSAFTKMVLALPEIIKENGHVFVSCFRKWEFNRMHTLLSRISLPGSTSYSHKTQNQQVFVQGAPMIDPYGEFFFRDGYFALFDIDSVTLQSRNCDTFPEPEFQRWEKPLISFNWCSSCCFFSTLAVVGYVGVSAVQTGIEWISESNPPSL